MYKPVVHPCLTAVCGKGVPSDESVVGLEEAWRRGGASLQGATEQTRTLQLQEQWLAAGMTGAQSHVRAEKLDWDELCSLVFPA